MASTVEKKRRMTASISAISGVEADQRLVFADVDPVEIGHDAVLLAIIGPGRVVQVVDLDAAGAAVIVEPGMVQAEFVAEFVDEGIEDIAADIGLVGLGVVEALADADIAIGRIGAAVVLLAELGADDLASSPWCSL